MPFITHRNILECSLIHILKVLFFLLKWVQRFIFVRNKWTTDSCCVMESNLLQNCPATPQLTATRTLLRWLRMHHTLLLHRLDCYPISPSWQHAHIVPLLSSQLKPFVTPIVISSQSCVSSAAWVLSNIPTHPYPTQTLTVVSKCWGWCLCNLHASITSSCIALSTGNRYLGSNKTWGTGPTMLRMVSWWHFRGHHQYLHSNANKDLYPCSFALIYKKSPFGATPAPHFGV